MTASVGGLPPGTDLVPRDVPVAALGRGHHLSDYQSESESERGLGWAELYLHVGHLENISV